MQSNFKEISDCNLTKILTNLTPPFSFCFFYSNVGWIMISFFALEKIKKKISRPNGTPPSRPVPRMKNYRGAEWLLYAFTTLGWHRCKFVSHSPTENGIPHVLTTGKNQALLFRVPCKASAKMVFLRGYPDVQQRDDIPPQHARPAGRSLITLQHNTAALSSEETGGRSAACEFVTTHKEERVAAYNIPPTQILQLR